jgi:excisionase family DNA binding protein
MANDSGYLTVSEACEMLHVSHPTLRKHVNEGKLPRPIRVGRRLLFPVNELHKSLSGLREDQ